MYFGKTSKYAVVSKKFTTSRTADPTSLILIDLKSGKIVKMETPDFKGMNTMKTIGRITFLYDRCPSNIPKYRFLVLDQNMRKITQIPLFHSQLKIRPFGRLIKLDFSNPSQPSNQREQTVILRFDKAGRKLLNSIGSVSRLKYEPQRTVESEKEFFGLAELAEARGLDGRFGGSRSGLKATIKNSAVFFEAKTVLSLHCTPQEKICRYIIKKAQNGSHFSAESLSLSQVLNFGEEPSVVKNIYNLGEGDQKRRCLILDYLEGENFSHIVQPKVNLECFRTKEAAKRTDHQRRFIRVFEQLEGSEDASGFRYRLREEIVLKIDKHSKWSSQIRLRSGTRYDQKMRILYFWKEQKAGKQKHEMYYLSKDLNLVKVYESPDPPVDVQCLGVDHRRGTAMFLTVDADEKVVKVWENKFGNLSS